MADEKVIDLDRLDRFHDNLKLNGLPLNNWQANKKYKVGYTIIQDGKFYRCKTEHTSTTTFDVTKFDLVGGSGSGISNWASNTSYSVGDLVVYGNGIYQCKTAHTSTTTFDDTKWTNLSIGYEKENLYTGTTFNTSILTVTTSDSMLTKDFLIVKIAYSEDGSTVLMNKTFALVPVVGEVQDFSYQESTTDYIVVTGEITDATTFVFNFLEAYTIDNFKIVSIDGITLGSSSGGGSSGTTISDWATGTTYSVGDLVIHDNNIYQCNTNHTSTTFSADESKWNLIGSKGIDFYTVGESYEVGAIVIYSGNIYQCITAHTATSTFDTTKWEEISASENGISEWQASTEYEVGDVLIYNDCIYRCDTAHTSTSTFDDTKFTQLTYEPEEDTDLIEDIFGGAGV